MTLSQQLEDRVDDGGSSQPGLTVWGRIVTELARLQDAAASESPGSVINPICGRPYIVDTCCAAAVFAAEHQRTGDDRWQTRANDAVKAARSGVPFRGIDEPAWDVLGWHDLPESLAATGIAVDAYCDARNRLGLALDEDHVGDLFDLLLRCRTGKGGFAHNAPREGQEAAEVQNVTASALNLLGLLASGKTDSHPVYTGLDSTLLRLGRGQRASGFWPYRHPASSLSRALNAPFKALLRPRLFFYRDRGDVTHHLMALYFAAGYFSSSGAGADTGMLASGWSWIRKRLVDGGEGSLSIDWAADSAPKSPQYSNARDTNAYFLILGAIPRLASLGIVERSESRAIAEALLAHIGSSLTATPGRIPCIIPSEGPPEIVRNILPMFEQSVAWKGRLMVEITMPQPGVPE